MAVTAKTAGCSILTIPLFTQHTTMGVSFVIKLWRSCQILISSSWIRKRRLLMGQPLPDHLVKRFQLGSCLIGEKSWRILTMTLKMMRYGVLAVVICFGQLINWESTCWESIVSASHSTTFSRVISRKFSLCSNVASVQVHMPPELACKSISIVYITKSTFCVTNASVPSQEEIAMKGIWKTSTLKMQNSLNSLNVNNVRKNLHVIVI